MVMRGDERVQNGMFRCFTGAAGVGGVEQSSSRRSRSRARGTNRPAAYTFVGALPGRFAPDAKPGSREKVSVEPIRFPNQIARRRAPVELRSDTQTAHGSTSSCYLRSSPRTPKLHALFSISGPLFLTLPTSGLQRAACISSASYGRSGSTGARCGSPRSSHVLQSARTNALINFMGITIHLDAED